MFAETVWPHDDWLQHLVDEQHIVRGEVAQVQRGCRHPGVVGMPLDVDQLQAIRVEGFLDLLLEVTELVDVATGLARVELADNLPEQAREAPTFDSDVD
ncbi:hypothetical protein D3C87_1398250 [compost metagenome]